MCDLLNLLDGGYGGLKSLMPCQLQVLNCVIGVIFQWFKWFSLWAELFSLSDGNMDQFVHDSPAPSDRPYFPPTASWFLHCWEPMARLLSTIHPHNSLPLSRDHARWCKSARAVHLYVGRPTILAIPEYALGCSAYGPSQWAECNNPTRIGWYKWEELLVKTIAGSTHSLCLICSPPPLPVTPKCVHTQWLLVLKGSTQPRYPIIYLIPQISFEA